MSRIDGVTGLARSQIAALAEHMTTSPRRTICHLVADGHHATTSGCACGFSIWSVDHVAAMIASALDALDEVSSGLLADRGRLESTQ